MLDQAISIKDQLHMTPRTGFRGRVLGGGAAAVVLALLVALGPAAAAPADPGWSAVASGDYAAALKYWKPLAEGGNAGAQHGLGYLYFTGKGVPQDPDAAFSWYTKSADQANPYAEEALGDLYAKGKG